MFRHQLSTDGDPAGLQDPRPRLLKAAVIHDLFEDAPAMPGVTDMTSSGSMPTARLCLRW